MRDEWLFPNRATPPGSSAYYSVRFAPFALRHDFAAILAWRHQVRAILDQVSDPGVARVKLQWWREELERIDEGDPRHPLSELLAPLLRQHSLPTESLEEIADGVEAELLDGPSRDEEALGTACERDLGTAFELLGRCQGVADQESLAAARRLGAFCARVYLIRNSGPLLRRGRSPVAADLLHRNGLSARDLTQPQNRTQLSDLLANSAERARTALGQADALAGVPSCIRGRGAVLQALLAELERSDFDVADQRIGLTPLRKLWLTWRESRRQPLETRTASR